jgi:co-chaperonin GroES (HSP10)
MLVGYDSYIQLVCRRGTVSDIDMSKAQNAAPGRTRLNIKGSEFEEKFSPAFDWCLIKMTDREESIPDAMKKSGIIEIAHVNQQARNKDGVIVKMGPHCHTSDYTSADTKQLEVGDRVYYGAWSGQETPCPPGYIMVRSQDLSLLLDPDTKLEWI